MPTIVVPIADNADMAAAWACSAGVDRYALIDDGLTSDGDATYISRDASAAVAGTPAVKLGPVTDPGTDNGFVLTEYARNAALGTTTLQWALYQGDPAAAGALLESGTFTVNSTAYGTAKTVTLAAATIAAVTDFTDLWVKVSTNAALAITMRVTDVFLVVPDADSGDEDETLPCTGAQ